MLTGFFPLEDVDSYVARTSPGIYIFSRDGKTAAYVGRSDDDVRIQIKKLICEDYGYTYCLVEYASSPKEAYIKECEYYHEYGPPDNLHHPTAPTGTNWKCPVEGCQLS